MFGYCLGVTDVVFPGTFTREGQAFFIHPCSEIGTMHLMALLFEEQGCDGAVNATGKGYKDFGHLFIS
jgi:hypothetical protein